MVERTHYETHIALLDIMECMTWSNRTHYETHIATGHNGVYDMVERTHYATHITV